MMISGYFCIKSNPTDDIVILEQSAALNKLEKLNNHTLKIHINIHLDIFTPELIFL